MMFKPQSFNAYNQANLIILRTENVHQRTKITFDLLPLNNLIGTFQANTNDWGVSRNSFLIFLLHYSFKATLGRLYV